MKQVSITKNPLVLTSSFHQSISPQKLFSKCRFVILLAGFVILLSSCQKEDLFNLFHEHHKQTVPLIAVFHVTLKNIQASTDVLPELDSVTGIGEGSPIGISSFMGLAKFAPAPDFSLTGNATITSENGDQIFSAVHGPGPAVNPPNIVLTYKATITGGTGKFAGATGGWTTIAHASTDTPAGIDSLQGTITY